MNVGTRLDLELECAQLWWLAGDVVTAARAIGRCKRRTNTRILCCRIAAPNILYSLYL